MKRVLLYIGILALLFAAPVASADVGKLRPVQVVSVYKEKGWVVIETDTEDKGYGTSGLQALQNLKDTSNGIIYLDTAEYLLITDATAEVAEELRQHLKAGVRLCMAAKHLELKEVSRFLGVHGRLPRLKEWTAGEELPILSTFGNSLTFLKKVEKSA